MRLCDYLRYCACVIVCKIACVVAFMWMSTFVCVRLCVWLCVCVVCVRACVIACVLVGERLKRQKCSRSRAFIIHSPVHITIFASVPGLSALAGCASLSERLIESAEREQRIAIDWENDACGK